MRTLPLSIGSRMRRGRLSGGRRGGLGAARGGMERVMRGGGNVLLKRMRLRKDGLLL